ncbi:hypothetical protein JCM8097_003330 [Rhodosporidiobolus ruineniae]
MSAPSSSSTQPSRALTTTTPTSNSTYTVQATALEDGTVREVLTLADSHAPDEVPEDGTHSTATGSSTSSAAFFRNDGSITRDKRPAEADAEPDLPIQRPRLGPLHRRTADDGHFKVTIGDTLADPHSDTRYTLEAVLGAGTWANFVRATESPSGRVVALKVSRALERYREGCSHEVEIVRYLEQYEQQQHLDAISRIHSAFEVEGHPVHVVPLLTTSLYKYLKGNSYQPFPLLHVQLLMSQTLHIIHTCHRAGITHTDLRPENLLLTSASSDEITRSNGNKYKMLRDPQIHILDFSGATRDDEYHASLISTRHYRAPEVILSMGWSHSADMWSLGCIFAELVLGKDVFPIHDDFEHLVLAQRLVGHMSLDFARRAKGSVLPECTWFERSTAPEHAALRRPPWVLRAPAAHPPLLDVPDFDRLASLEVNLRRALGDEPLASLVVELITSLLRWEPTQRLTASQALAHPFFSASIPLAPPPFCR